MMVATHSRHLMSSPPWTKHLSQKQDCFSLIPVLKAGEVETVLKHGDGGEKLDLEINGKFLEAGDWTGAGGKDISQEIVSGAWAGHLLEKSKR